MALSMVERGRLGGRATVAKHGRDHMRRVGKAGFRAVLAKYEKGAAARGVVAGGDGAVWDPYTWLLWKLGYVNAANRRSYGRR